MHDVKAVEYFLKSRLAAAPEGSALHQVGELVHFACTSEDINNLSYALMVRGAVQEVWAPAATALVDQVAALAHDLADQPMLALTHGQPATPTTLGKELAVLAHRLRRQLTRIGTTSTWASSTARRARTARTSSRSPVRTGRPSARRSSSTWA